MDGAKTKRSAARAALESGLATGSLQRAEPLLVNRVDDHRHRRREGIGKILTQISGRQCEIARARNLMASLTLFLDRRENFDHSQIRGGIERKLRPPLAS